MSSYDAGSIITAHTITRPPTSISHGSHEISVRSSVPIRGGGSTWDSKSWREEVFEVMLSDEKVWKVLEGCVSRICRPLKNLLYP